MVFLLFLLLFLSPFVQVLGLFYRLDSTIWAFLGDLLWGLLFFDLNFDILVGISFLLFFVFSLCLFCLYLVCQYDNPLKVFKAVSYLMILVNLEYFTDTILTEFCKSLTAFHLLLLIILDAFYQICDSAKRLSHRHHELLLGPLYFLLLRN